MERFLVISAEKPIPLTCPSASTWRLAELPKHAKINVRSYGHEQTLTPEGREQYCCKAWHALVKKLRHEIIQYNTELPLVDRQTLEEDWLPWRRDLLQNEVYAIGDGVRQIPHLCKAQHAT